MNNNYGCFHYNRYCEIYTECCNKYYICRLCHDYDQTHQLDRYKINQIRCLICNTKQNITNKCIQCNITFGEYYCNICHLYDNNQQIKNIYHCNKCNICRIGKKENYFHCDKCVGCINIINKDTHLCIENNLLDNCVICLDNKFNSRTPISILKCGHSFHLKCLEQIKKLICPLCRKYII